MAKKKLLHVIHRHRVLPDAQAQHDVFISDSETVRVEIKAGRYPVEFQEDDTNPNVTVAWLG